MKRLVCVLLALLLLSGCAGNFGSTDLKEAMEIPENGIIEKPVIQQIKDENAVAVFCGESNGLKYEWKLFGKDIVDAKDANLHVDLMLDGEVLTAVFAQQENLGFSSMLSIYLPTKWSYLTASAYRDDVKVYSVSLTGTKEKSTLNLFVTETLGTLCIRPDSQKDPTLTEPDSTEPLSTTPNATRPGHIHEYTDTVTAPSCTSAGYTTHTCLCGDSYRDNEVPAAGHYYKTTTVAPTETRQGYDLHTCQNCGASYKDNYTDPLSGETQPSNTTEPTKGEHLTDPVPSGMPEPVEPGDAVTDTDTVYTCYFSIECSTIFNNLSMLNPAKLELLPTDGVILAEIEVSIYAGESVFDVLQRVCRENNIHMESSWTPMYNTAYVEGIANLYEFDCGDLSGWMYRVNGWYPNYGCSRYQLKDGDVIEWRYTCDLGRDVGDNWSGGT